ncbi:MAG: bacteriohemerythrin [Rhodanobacteraceae bacterium]|mgnify:FL=1|nr:bacteriohemerythrin [Rhodanobacteraceae bacterium]
MSVVQWSPAFATGVREIDDQHKRLVDYINELQTPGGPGNGGVSRVLESAIDYTLYHFAFEEALMESRGYPLLDAHKNVHDAFAQELRALKARFVAGTMTADQLREALARWLFDHISRADTAALRTQAR